METRMQDAENLERDMSDRLCDLKKHIGENTKNLEGITV